MFIKKSLKQISIFCILLLCSFYASANDFRLIGNKSIAFDSTEADIKIMLKKMYLRQINEWPDGTPVKIYLPDEGSASLDWFYTNILGMSASEVAEYWLKLKQKTGETPHRQIASNSMLLKVVNQFAGAWGVVVGTEADLPENVKTIISK